MSAVEKLRDVARRPEDVGLSSERLRRIRPALEAEVAAKRIPGAVVMVARHGEIAHCDAIGLRDPASGVDMTADTIFSIASMTKAMTSVAILMLYEEGRLLLSDPASKYLPQLAGMQVGVGAGDAFEFAPATRDFTIQDLLRHTSGLTYPGRGDTEAHRRQPGDPFTMAVRHERDDFLELLGKTPLLYQPGTAWEYGFSTDILGFVVEVVSGKTLGSFLKERLWEPLGMVDTSFALAPEKAARYARAFPNDPLTGQPVTIFHATGAAVKWETGGGGAVSTAADYMRFLQMLLDGGIYHGHRYLGRKTVAYMTSDHLGTKIENRVTTMDASCEGYGFGLGVAVRLQTGVAGVVGSTGDWYWSGVFGTYFWVDPQEKLICVFMAMAPGMIRLRYRALLRPLVLQAVVD